MRSSAKSGLIKLGLATFCALASVSAVHAQDAPSADEQAQKAADLRQSVFKLIAWNFDPVAGMLKNKVPFDAAVVQKSAARLEVLAPMITEAFQTDTRKASVKTKAREAVWTNNADFKAKNDDFAKASAALSVAAKGGEKKAVMQAVAAVGKACGACHDSFRDK